MLFDLGVPVTDIDTIQYGLGVEDTSITIFPGASPQFYVDYVNRFGSHNTAIPATIGWIRDGRDSLIYPTSGTYHRASSEVGVPGASLRY